MNSGHYLLDLTSLAFETNILLGSEANEGCFPIFCCIVFELSFGL